MTLFLRNENKEATCFLITGLKGDISGTDFANYFETFGLISAMDLKEGKLKLLLNCDENYFVSKTHQICGRLFLIKSYLCALFAHFEDTSAMSLLFSCQTYVKS